MINLIETLPPLSLYVHIPWCVRKCPYCDFNSHQVKGGLDALPEDEYIDALIEDLKQERPYVQGRKLHSIFFGGGTPSLLSAKGIGRILDSAERLIGFESNIEITLEANPGTAEQAKFTGFYQAGVNRLSMGVQSFNAKHLEKLGRIHSGDEAINAVAMARKAGFERFNLDLMHGLPDQTPEQALADLQQALDLAPPHLSWYQLTIEPNTEYFRRPPTLPEDDFLADIQQQGETLLAEHGFTHYEISAFAKPNEPSRHNLNYWRFGDYLGIGAGAHGKVTLLDDNSIQPIHAGKQSLRRWKTRLPKDYLHRAEAKNPNFCAGEQFIEQDDLLLEYMMNVLRLRQGVEMSLQKQRIGVEPSENKAIFEQLIQKGLLESSSNQLKLTEMGNRFLNSVLEQFS